MAELGFYALSSLLGAGLLFNQRKQARDLIPSHITTLPRPKVGENIYHCDDLVRAQQEEAKRATVFHNAAQTPMKSNIIPLYFNTIHRVDDNEKIPNAGYNPELIYKVLNNLDSTALEQVEAKSRLVVTNNGNNHDPEWGITMDRPVHSRAVGPLDQIGGSLTGGTEDFTHNNMVPFFGKSVTQDMRTENRAKDGMLELYTGQFKLNQQQKTEKPLLFKPVRDLTNIYGSVEQRDMTRYVPSNLGKKNNETAYGNDNVQVGPGLNKGFTNEPSGGFHNTFRILPKPIEQLRVDPVVETEAKTNTARSTIEKRPLISQVYKNTPDLLVENKNGERNFRTVGAVTGRKLRPALVVRDTARMKSQSYFASAKATTDKHRVIAKTQKTKRTQHRVGDAAFRNVNTTVKAVNDYGKKSVRNVPTNRATSGQVIGNVKGPKANKNATSDKARKTRKQFYAANAKIYGNAGVQKPSALPINFAPARVTVKETTLSPAMLGGATTEVKRLVAYDPNDRARTTVNETTLDQQPLSNATPLVKRLVAYDPNDRTRVTINETTLGQQPLSNATPLVKRLIAYDPNDRMRTTVNETTLSDQPVSNATPLVKKNIAYDPNDRARTTINETTLGQQPVSNATPLVKKNIAYDPNDRARVTINETTLSHVPASNATPLVKRMIAYDPEDVPDMTMKDFSMVKNYLSTPLAVSHKQDKNRKNVENARMNTIKADIAKGRPNLTGGPNLGHSNTATAMLQSRKMEDDRRNVRGNIKTSNDLSIYNPTKDCRQTSGKNLLLPQEDTRLDTRILDAFKQNPLTQSLTSAP